ncbi:hypothetical protein EDC04DRAFT_1566281 [Pisolithus marmoratus]|nr:hypothetical protein EDC04DRAFT_1566281 [Pisolithus marmoratus]
MFSTFHSIVSLRFIVPRSAVVHRNPIVLLPPLVFCAYLAQPRAKSLKILGANSTRQDLPKDTENLTFARVVLELLHFSCSHRAGLLCGSYLFRFSTGSFDFWTLRSTRRKLPGSIYCYSIRSAVPEIFAFLCMCTPATPLRPETNQGAESPPFLLRNRP